MLKPLQQVIEAIQKSDRKSLASKLLATCVQGLNHKEERGHGIAGDNDKGGAC